MHSGDIVQSDLHERFSVLRYQENHVYIYKDYLSFDFKAKNWHEQLDAQDELANINFLPSGPRSCPLPSSGVNEVWREKICEWCYQVVDHFDFSRETVDVTLSYLDRFLSTRPVNKKIFQVAAMASLYLAVKLYEPGILRLSSLVELSKNVFTEDQVVAMEETILCALSWHVHPPTYLSFVREFLILVPLQANSEYHNFVELSRFLTELAVCDYFFVPRRPSSVGIACLLNAFDFICKDDLRKTIFEQFSNAVRDVAGLDCFDHDVEECRLRLRKIYLQSGYQYHEEHTDDGAIDRTNSISPVCVSEMNPPCAI